MEGVTGFARVGEARVAYQITGSGLVDLVATPGSFVSFDITDEDPMAALYYRRIASFTRVVRFDRRGAGSSDPVPLDALPSIESYVEETLAVMDTAGLTRAAIMAGYDAGPMAILLAATRPERVSALILGNTTARYLAADDYPIGFDRDAAEQIAETFAETWGTEGPVSLYVPSRADDPRFLSWFARLQRLTISPSQAAAYLRALFDVDVRAMLPSVACPTLVLHRSEFLFIPLAHGEYIAEHIPKARLVTLPGQDGPLIWEGPEQVLDALEEFLTDAQPADRSDRAITTVVFSDIVGSTRRAEEMGDRRWRALLGVYEEIAAREVSAHQGRLVKSTGDGFLATFDGPGRAIAMADRLRSELRPLEIESRTGIHTGEVAIRGNDLAGLGVHLASRVMGLADPGEILVSSTVKELLVGSDFHFEDRGRHKLKGFDDSWQVFSVRTR